MNKRKISGYCLLIVSIVIFLFSFELILRIANIPWLQDRMEMLNIGKGSIGTDKEWEIIRRKDKFYSYKPNSSFRVWHYEYRFTAHIDEWGGRVTVVNPTVRNPLRVPCFGDSMLFGLGVNDRQTFLSLVGERSPYRLLNFGIPGSSLSEQLDVLEMRHEQLQSPSVYVFVFFTGNDYPLSHQEKPWPHISRRRGEVKSFKEGLILCLEVMNGTVTHNTYLKKIYFLQFLKEKLLLLFNQRDLSGGKSAFMDPVFCAMNKNNIDRMHEYLVSTFDRLEGLSQRLHFKSIFIIVPDRHQVDQKLLMHKIDYYGLSKSMLDVEQPVRMLRQELERRGIAYIDLFPCFSGKAEGLYYKQDNHLTRDGNDAAFRCIGTKLDSLVSAAGAESIQRLWN